MLKWSWIKSCGLVIAVSASACIDKQEINNEPIAEVAVDRGGVVQFFEPTPGELMITQTAPRGVQPATDSELTPIELYKSLAPNVQPPDALVAAQARQDLARFVRPRGDARQTQPANDDWFSDNYCDDLGGFYQVVFCKLNRKTEFWSQINGSEDAYWATCAQNGAVQVEIRIDGELRRLKDVLEGDCYFVHWFNGDNQDARGEVNNVLDDVDVYDHSARYHF
jgi:hypothetical protein